jgi:hypothetical protein
MKKMLLILFVLLLLPIYGCNNKSIEINKAYTMVNSNFVEYEVDTMKVRDDGKLEVTLKDGTVVIANDYGLVLNDIESFTLTKTEIDILKALAALNYKYIYRNANYVYASKILNINFSDYLVTDDKNIFPYLTNRENDPMLISELLATVKD